MLLEKRNVQNDRLQKIGFGGGCHWCTEAVFQALKGVHDVRQGFIRSVPPHDAPSEAVELAFDPQANSLEQLIGVHLTTHASTAAHKMRGKYRSAIYVFNVAQGEAVAEVMERIAAQTGTEFVTQVLEHRGFEPSNERFHNYYQNGPERPFCKTYIDPKLAKIRQGFPALMR